MTYRGIRLLKDKIIFLIALFFLFIRGRPNEKAECIGVYVLLPLER